MEEEQDKVRQTKIPKKQLEVISRLFGNIREIQEESKVKIADAESRLLDVFTIIDDMYDCNLVSGKDHIDTEGNLVRGSEEPVN